MRLLRRTTLDVQQTHASTRIDFRGALAPEEQIEYARNVDLIQADAAVRDINV